MLGAFLAVLLCAAPETRESVKLSADLLLHDEQAGRTTADGHARLETAESALDADHLTYDREGRVATAVGNVVARLTAGGLVVIIADVVTLRFDRANEVEEVFLQDGTAWSKQGTTKEALLATHDAASARRLGKTQALLSGNHLQRRDHDWRVEALELVPCECDFERPTWSLTSSSATVHTAADRVSVVNPVVRIKGVPILWLPWLSLPLTDRQTGLLFPRPGFASSYGFALDAPVFITLGRSADLTLTPGFFTGGTNPTGVAGPRLLTEFRYVPSETTAGRLNLGLLYDFRTARDVAFNELREPGTRRGVRGDVQWQHRSDFGSGLGAAVDLNVHSDGDYNEDLVVDAIALSNSYLRSSLTAFHRGVDHVVSLDLGLRQDIRFGYDALGRGTIVERSGRVLNPFGPGTLQRLPALTFGWSPSFEGPARFTLDAEAVRLAPLFSTSGDEGVLAGEGRLEAEPFRAGVARLFDARSTVSGAGSHEGMGDRLWQPGEREARDRLMIYPRVTLAAPSEALAATLEVGWRELAIFGEASGRAWNRGYLVVGGRLETELARRFGSVRHVLQPRLEVRAVPLGFDTVEGGPANAPGGVNGSALIAYDHLEAAVPNVNPRFQAVLELRQRLVATNGQELLRLEVGQGAELSGASYAALNATLGETFARLGSQIGVFSASGVVRFDPLGSRFAPLDAVTGLPRPELAPAIGLTRLAGTARVDDSKGHSAYASYENVLIEGTARSRQPIDLLFLIERGYTSVTRVQQVTFGAAWSFGPVSVRYDALVAEQRPLDAAGAPRSTEPNQLTMTQQTFGVGLSPVCDCWRVDVNAVQQLYPVVLFPAFSLNVTIANFGTIGSR